MKIVVLDHPRENPGEINWSKLSQFGDVTIYPRTPADKLVEAIGDAEIVFTNKSPITRQVIEACPSVRFISIIATGYNTVDIEAAREHGILVSNVPSYGTGAIAQHAIALLLEITNHVAYHDSQVRLGRKGEHDGDWCFWDYPIIELENKTMGIIGLGRIGQFTARTAISFGMKVIAYDKYENDDMKKIGVKYVDFDTLLTESHVITLHCPLFEYTKEMINRNTISKMRDGVILINSSRGGLVDEAALAEALRSGKIYAAGLDVLSAEPPMPNNPLLELPNCFITPHISWAALECRQRLVQYAIDNLAAYLAGTPKNLIV
jgi:glycerate dehydrogenase